MRSLFIRAIGASALLLCVSANAALIDRGEGFIYDDVLDVTWAQNANINGLDTWANQVAWAAGYSQTHSVYGTFDDWRLPTTLQPDPSCGDQINPGGGFPLQGYSWGCTGSEMAHLYDVYGIWAGSPGLFTNVYVVRYWSGTEYAPYTDYAWRVSFLDGGQSLDYKAGKTYAFAVRDGDISASVVPVPAAVWLFGSALAGLAGLRRRTGAIKGIAAA